MGVVVCRRRMWVEGDLGLGVFRLSVSASPSGDECLAFGIGLGASFELCSMGRTCFARGPGTARGRTAKQGPKSMALSANDATSGAPPHKTSPPHRAGLAPADPRSVVRPTSERGAWLANVVEGRVGGQRWGGARVGQRCLGRVWANACEGRVGGQRCEGREDGPRLPSPTGLSCCDGRLSASLPLCLSASLPLCLSASLPLCLSASLPLCLSASLPLCLSALSPPRRCGSARVGMKSEG
ncbi:hypothetical protein CLV68_1656 [Actinokineospora cianjurensis]|uniref:Uncharacterized protein n=1 Tax=Actinokineospora cianjurensis TaxID=585224 RepID=A0A421B9N5_9PSEU|nr:hypothetical protein CLV68_1656 [Actinokineospora cianjurensis]